MTSSNGNIFRILLALCKGNPPVSVASPYKGQWRGALMFLFYLRLCKRLSKHSRRRWFKTPSRSLWRHCNVRIRIRTFSACFVLSHLFAPSCAQMYVHVHGLSIWKQTHMLHIAEVGMGSIVVCHIMSCLRWYVEGFCEYFNIWSVVSCVCEEWGGLIHQRNSTTVDTQCCHR